MGGLRHLHHSVKCCFDSCANFFEFLNCFGECRRMSMFAFVLCPASVFFFGFAGSQPTMVIANITIASLARTAAEFLKNKVILLIFVFWN